MAARLTLTLLASCLTLTACGMGGGDTPKAGEYSTDIKLVEIQMPGIDPSMKDQMQQMMPQGQTACLTDEQITKGQWADATDDMIKQMEAGGQCKRIRDNNTATALDTQIECTSPGEGTATITMTGQTTTDGMTAKMVTEGKDPKGEAMKMVVEINSKRVGDCKE